MAKTYYKYVEREQDSRVNWNEVSRDLTARLKLETEDRALQKEEIEEQTRALLNYQDNPPAGLNSTLNQQVQNLSSDLMEATILQQKLLKSGELSMRAYKNIRQNMQDDTENYYRVYKGYNDKFAYYAERQQPGSAANGIDKAGSWLEAKNMVTLEEMHNFTKYTPTVNAGLGGIDLLEFDENGDVVKGKGASVKDYLTRMESEYDSYDLNKKENNEVDRLGLITSAKYVGDLSKGIITLEAARLNPEFNEWLNTATIEIMGDDLQMSQILGDNMKTIPLNEKGEYDPKGRMKPFEITDDPEVTGDQYVLRYRDPNGGRPLYAPTTDKQKDLLKDYVESRLIARLTSKETLTSDYVAPDRTGTINRNAIRKTKQYDLVSTLATNISTGKSGNETAIYLTNVGNSQKIKNADGYGLSSQGVSFDGKKYSFNWADGSIETFDVDRENLPQTIRAIGSKYYSDGLTDAISALPSKLKKFGEESKGLSPKITASAMNRAERAYNTEKIRLEKLVAGSNKEMAAAADSELTTLKADAKNWKEKWIIDNPNPYLDFNKPINSEPK